MLQFSLRSMRALAAALFAMAVAASSARAQLQTPDPYDPYGRAYRSFAYPGASDGPYGPGAGPPNRSGLATANQFDLRGTDLGFSGGLRTGRYDNAYRRFDREFGREYVPNQKADEEYYKDREKRESESIRAMIDRNPARRGALDRDAGAEAARQPNTESNLSVRRGIPAAPARRPSRSGVAAATSTAAPRRAAAPTDSSRTPAPARRGSVDSSIPPAPPSGRRGLERADDVRPSDVLQRSRDFDRPREKVTSPRRTGNSAPSAPR